MRKAIISLLITLIPVLVGVGIDVSGYHNPEVTALCFIVASLLAVWVIALPILLGWEKYLRDALHCKCRILETNYPSDMEFAGIRWRKEFVDVRLAIRNRANVPVHNIDLEVRLDTSLAGIGQITNLQMESNIVQTMNLDSVRIGTAGEETPSFPVTGNPEVFCATSNNSGRVSLPLIPSGFTANLVLATVAMSAFEDNKRKEPEWIEINGHYETGKIDGGKRYPIEFHQQFT